jgi:mono/diheme cytochrome c family protein
MYQLLKGLRFNGRKAVLASVTALAFTLSATQGVVAQERVGDFALLDQDGRFHHMAWYDNNKAIAFLVQASGDSATQNSLASFNALKEQYTAQGIIFMMINPLGEQRAVVKADADSLGIDIPVLIDDAQIISEALGIDKTGEAFLYDPKSFRVIYRGPADQSMADALAAVVAGNAVANAVVASQGTAVSYPARDQLMQDGVSYSKDVAPVLAENCATCHRDGGIAPFALNSHAMAQGWSPMIREVLMTKRMPPGQIDPHIGNFRNHYTLTPDEQQKVLQWIASGSVNDGDTDPLAELTWSQEKWAFGEPDLIIKIPQQSIPATGVLDYIDVVVPLEGLDRDRWVRASQYVPGDRTVLHHTLNAFIEPGQRPSQGLITRFSNPDQAYITPYIPGADPHVEEPNTGGVLRAGTMLALNLHYTTTGRETVDNSEIGVWFYPDDQIPTERRLGDCACIFPQTWTDIPAFDPDFEQTAFVTIPTDSEIMAFTPHMHFRGKRMVWDAHYPDGTVERLLNVAQYNYNWQMEYQLAEPKFVPAGTRVVVTGAFDNSEQNKANPDPSRVVPWGQQSWDEMFFGQVYWKEVKEGTAVSAN